MGRIREPREVIDRPGMEALIGYPGEDDPAMTQEEIEQILRSADIVNSILGIDRKEPEILLSSGVREIPSDVGPATRCDLCGHVFGLERMVKLSGKYYCTVNECAEETMLGTRRA